MKGAVVPVPAARPRRLRELTPEEELAQGTSFVYGNLHIENPTITKESVAATGEELARRGRR